MRMTELHKGVGEVSLIDYVDSQGDILHKQVPFNVVMVGSQSDLASIKDNYDPGVVAFTAGFGNVWQLDADGEWQEVE